ncbi:RNA-binding transcriptional accessory protein, partial [Guyparkeria sp. 1SP6A2]|nr:RNA-binding transcriptional accessory protein [Guyparkeria sp. 1SP6A2]
GARDIIAELISEHSDSREKMRTYFEKNATYKSALVKNKETEAIKYKDYFDWEETAKNGPSHRVLAMRRGEEEGYLKLDVLPEDEGA